MKALKIQSYSVIICRFAVKYAVLCSFAYIFMVTLNLHAEPAYTKLLLDNEAFRLCYKTKELYPEVESFMLDKSSSQSGPNSVKVKSGSVVIFRRTDDQELTVLVEIDRFSRDIVLSGLIGKEVYPVKKQLCTVVKDSGAVLGCAVFDTEELEIHYHSGKITRMTLRCGVFAD